MISACAPDGHNGDDGNGAKQKQDELRVELLIRGTTGPAPNSVA